MRKRFLLLLISLIGVAGAATGVCVVVRPAAPKAPAAEEGPAEAQKPATTPAKPEETKKPAATAEKPAATTTPTTTPSAKPATPEPTVAKASFFPYYNMLTANERLLYNELRDGISQYNYTIYPSGSYTTDEAMRVIEAVYNDHPELFWLDSTFTCHYSSGSGYITDISPSYYTNLMDSYSKNLLESRANAIIAKAKTLANDYEKEKYVHNAIIAGATYDVSAANHQSAYSALVDGRTICAGYARAFQYIMIKLGIPTYYVSGNSRGEAHAWNLVQLNDGFYNVDLTWNDKLNSQKYFNKNDSFFAADHTRSALSARLPKATATKYLGK